MSLLFKVKAQQVWDADHEQYHSSEQQSHENGPCDQEEDDKDADDFIQRSLQPHDYLHRGGGNGG